MWAQIFGAIGKGGSAILGAHGDYQAAKQAGVQMQATADGLQQQGRDQAALIRRAGRAIRGQQVAQYAANGVMIGEGSAGEVERQTVTDVEHDAFQAILQGDRQALALRTQDKVQRIAAKASQLAVLIDPLFANPQAMQGWKTYSPASTGSAAGASGYDPAGFNGTNDRGSSSVGGNGLDWWVRNGSGGD